MIQAVAVERRFGERRGVGPISFELRDGGFLVVTGPNGSGKSTLLALAAGLLVPTRGRLDVKATRREVGYVAHDPLVYRELSALENLDLYGRLYRVPERRERVGMVLERFGLWERRHERVSAYSRGMAQRLALARALLHEPSLVLLDEPYASLDEAAADVLDAELAGLRGERTVVVASHQPERLAPLATAELAL